MIIRPQATPSSRGTGQPATFACWVVLLAVSLCCWTHPSTALARDRAPVRSLLEMRQDKVVVQEWDLSCGAAALATILNYQHNEAVSEREIAKGLIKRDAYVADPSLVRARHGFSLLDLKRYVDGRGYEGIGYGKLVVEDLIERAPIMVPVRLRGYNHFVVFRGILGGSVLVADPAFGNRTMSIEKFEGSSLRSMSVSLVRTSTVNVWFS